MIGKSFPKLLFDFICTVLVPRSGWKESSLHITNMVGTWERNDANDVNDGITDSFSREAESKLTIVMW